MIRPTFLLSDSRLLFHDRGPHLLRDAAQGRDDFDSITAAYIGAGTADQPEYYSIFMSAMELCGISDCAMISSDYHHRDQARLHDAGIILLGGGDTSLAWQVLRETGMCDDIRECYVEGAILVGVSAGAILLGQKGWREEISSVGEIFEAIGLTPFVVGVHDEVDDWKALQAVLTRSGTEAWGLGLPMGSGVVYHPDASVEPIGKGAVEIRRRRGTFITTSLFPDSAKGGTGADEAGLSDNWSRED